MKVLSIGNSFSQDAQRYLHKLAMQEGEQLKAVNLYIGGCSLKEHYLNVLDDNAAYEFQFNGESTAVKVSIKQVLISDDWDVVTLQQASHYSARSETYFPYIEEVAAYVRKYCPRTKIFIHQTWAYEDGSDMLKNLTNFTTTNDMMDSISSAYEKAARLINADGIIPCGAAMFKAYKCGQRVYRDTFHASLGIGRYLLALCWYKKLFGKDITKNNFIDFEEVVTEKERQVVIAAINSIF